MCACAGSVKVYHYNCQVMCCRPRVEQNSQPFQPRDAATINALADTSGRNRPEETLCLSGTTVING